MQQQQADADRLKKRPGSGRPSERTFSLPSWSLPKRLPPPAALEAVLPCPGSREIYLREIVCEYVVL